MLKDMHESEIRASRDAYEAYLEALRVVVSFHIQGTWDTYLANEGKPPTDKKVKSGTRAYLTSRGLHLELLEALDELMPDAEMRKART